MDYQILLDAAVELGYQLAISGAETYRVEETITRILGAYGIQGEVFAIPNNLTVSIEMEEGHPLTCMRRIGHHGTDLDSVERYNALSRKICTQKPDAKTALGWVRKSAACSKVYPMWMYLVGSIFGGAGFILVYGGSVSDTAVAIICSIAAGLVNYQMGKWKVNEFFRTMLSAFFIALIAYLASFLKLTVSTDGVIISSIMLLVPGLLFTNALRDIIYGDTNSGINRIVQVLLIGAATALGTGAAWNVMHSLQLNPVMGTAVEHSLLLETLTTFVACCGFSILFNIHGKGIFLCALGGAFTWVVYGVFLRSGTPVVTTVFLAAVFAALYSEVMARIRKYPAISYLVVSIIPLLPGAGVYRATNALLQGDMAQSSQYAMETLSIAGAIAVGILIISTLARLWSTAMMKRQKK